MLHNVNIIKNGYIENNFEDRKINVPTFHIIYWINNLTKNNVTNKELIKLILS